MKIKNFITFLLLQITLAIVTVLLTVLLARVLSINIHVLATIVYIAEIVAVYYAYNKIFPTESDAEQTTEAPAPKTKLADIKGKTFNQSIADSRLFPVLLEDDLPSNLVLPVQVVDVLHTEFNLKDYETPLKYDVVKDFLTDNGIVVSLAEVHKEQKNGGFLQPGIMNNRPEAIKVEPPSISVSSDAKDVDLIMRYEKGDGTFTEVLAPTTDVFNGYLQQFKEIPAKFPTEAEFTAWHDNFVKTKSQNEAELLPAPDYSNKSLEEVLKQQNEFIANKQDKHEQWKASQPAYQRGDGTWSTAPETKPEELTIGKGLDLQKENVETKPAKKSATQSYKANKKIEKKLSSNSTKKAPAKSKGKKSSSRKSS